MSLAKFSIIVAIDGGNGIAKDGEIPWNSRSDMKFFRDVTVGRGKNAVIMGRITYESIPPQYRPLSSRHCVIISRTWKQEAHPEITVARSLLDALIIVGGSLKNYGEIFVAGGEQIYQQAIQDFMYLCKKVYVTKFKTNYECDQFFPWELVKDYPTFKDSTRTRDFVRYFISPNENHQEYQYLTLMKRIADIGEPKADRTGVGTNSIFGVRMEFDISERIPILTTKQVIFEKVIKELLFFVSGKTDTKVLEDQGVNFWKPNTRRQFLDDHNLGEYEEGDMGPLYGFQWRHWGTEYKGADVDYRDQGVDQLTNLIKGLRENPKSRRHILSAWNVGDLNKMALPPCHILAQFNVSGDRKYLDCQLYQRSGDFFLGVPFNIASYSILTHMIAHVVGLRPRKFIHVIGDAHVYNNHGIQVKKQLGRTPRPLPKLRFRKPSKLHKIDDFDFDSFIIEGYSSWPFISAKMAV